VSLSQLMRNARLERQAASVASTPSPAIGFALHARSPFSPVPPLSAFRYPLARLGAKRPRHGDEAASGEAIGAPRMCETLH
jgi:hypothetical protein